MPIGPFQSTVRGLGDARRRRSPRSPGPMSRPFQPSGIAPAGTMRVSASADDVLRDHEVDRDLHPAGRRARGGTRRPCRAAPASRRRAMPCASRNVNAIAPPTRTVSQRSSSASITPSLSLDLGAAEHRDERVLGVVRAAATAPRPRGAAAARRRAAGRAAGRRSTRARGATRRTPRSRRRRRARRGWSQNAGSHSVSPGSKRRFSSITTSPGAADATSGSTRGPDDRRAQQHLAPEQLAEARRDRGHRVLRVGLALRAARDARTITTTACAVAQPVDRRRARW